jgi:hypothetical protein
MPMAPVISLFILETLFVAFQIAGHMRIFGVGWGDVAMLDQLDWSLVASPFLNGLSKWWMPAVSDLNLGTHCVLQPPWSHKHSIFGEFGDSPGIFGLQRFLSWCVAYWPRGSLVNSRFYTSLRSFLVLLYLLSV